MDHTLAQILRELYEAHHAIDGLQAKVADLEARLVEANATIASLQAD